MISDGYVVDGSWNLRFYVTDLQMERTLRVKGDLHVGGVMLRLVEDLGKSDIKLTQCQVSCAMTTTRKLSGST